MNNTWPFPSKLPPEPTGRSNKPIPFNPDNYDDAPL